MAKILILYGTDDGHTQKVAKRIADIVNGAGHESELLKGRKASRDFSLEGYDAIIIGTSIHMGMHQLSVKQVVKKYKAEFEAIPTAYFCVCITAFSDKPEDKIQAKQYVDDFKKYTGLQPSCTAVFAGALRYPYYNFMKRFMVKLVARKLGADTDTSQVFEYTDWNAVERFANDFLGSLEQ